MRFIQSCILFLTIWLPTICFPTHSLRLQTYNHRHKAHQSFNSQINHQGPIPASEEAAQQAQADSEQFQKICNIGKKKINWIDIQNKLDNELRFGGLYQQEGDIFLNGEPIMRQNQTTKWLFTQTSTFLGTKGLIVYKIRDGSNNSLVVYFNSPTGNAWNSFGVCITPQNDSGQIPITQEVLKNQYNEIMNNLTLPPQNCLLSDNSKGRMIPQFIKQEKSIKSLNKSYQIGLVGKYEQTKQFILNCYRQEIAVVIESG